MTINKPFLEKLLKKLKSGDTRSIHLNALPGNYARLDIYDLVNIEPGMHLRFLNELLTKTNFTFSITIDPKIMNGKPKEEKEIIQKLIKRLNFMYYQEKDLFQEQGTKTFAFGYPMLIKRDPVNPKKIIKAPLLIWYLELEKDTSKNNTWKITRNEDQTLIFNEALQNHLETTEKIKVEDLEKYLEDGLIDEKELVQLTHHLLEKLSVKINASEELIILPCTNKESIEKLTDSAPWIRWSGVFGLYKAQKQSIIKDIETLLEKGYNLFEGKSYDSFQKENLTAVLLDPSQELVLNALEEKDKIIIQGPPGTGKSQTLTGIITNALLNGAHCLIVGEKRTAMEVIYNNLKAIGLGELCVLIEDINANRKPIVERIRTMVEDENPREFPFRQHEYEEYKGHYISLREEVNNRLNIVNQRFFGDYNWLELIAQREILLQELDITQLPVIDPEKFERNYDEYLSLKEIVKKGEELFRVFGQVKHPFNPILEKNYEGNSNPQDVFEAVKKLFTKVNTLITDIEQNISTYGKDFNQLKGFTQAKSTVLSIFGGKYKTIQQEKERCIVLYKELELIGNQKDLINYSLPSLVTSETFSTNMMNLLSLREILQPIVENEALFYKYFPFRAYAETHEVPVTKLLVNDLGVKDPSDWEQAFKASYFEKVLGKFAMENGIDDKTEKYLFDLSKNDVLLKKRIPEKILHLWENRRRETIATRNIARIKQLYNYRKNKQFESRNSLRKIIFSDFELFVNTFPVLMVSPVVASSILPLQEGLFDVVLMDEASQLRVEDTYSSLLRGKIKIISGDKHQMPPSSYFAATPVFLESEATEEDEDVKAEGDFLAESESLLEYASDSDYSFTYLDFHYRSHHPDLIQFSNAGFYNSRLVPMPEREDYVPIQFNQVNGLYEGNGINKTEAERIVNYLYEEIAVEDGQYPSVGVGTLNLNQRNFIWDLLMEKAYEDPKYSKHLEGLISAGLFVKNLENIQGDERDYILISTTFGPDKEGKFRQQFGPLTQAKGYQLLNVIITRAKKAIQIFTSIPEPVFTNFMDEIKDKGNTGKGIFYAYLAYAKAISDGNKSMRDSVLQALKMQSSDESSTKIIAFDDAFRETMAISLKSNIGEEKVLKDYAFGGLKLDFAIIDKDGKPVLNLECEGKHNHFGQAAYRLALFKKQLLENYQIPTYYIWSDKWRKDWKKEMQDLKLKIQAI